MMKRRNFLYAIGLGGLASFLPTIIKAAIAQMKSQSTQIAASDGDIVFYVAPNGKDAWSGKSATPNSNNTDGPFATLEKARNAIRQLKAQQNGKLKQSVTVEVLEGTYFLTKPLTFGEVDSGTEDYPITYQAYEGDKPVISGGRPIKGWQEEEVNGRTMWTVTLPGVKSGKWNFQQLWVNGERRNRSRHPNKGYFSIKAVPEAKREQWNEPVASFQFSDGDLPEWSSYKGGEAVVMSLWVDARMPITRVDNSKQMIYFSKKSSSSLTPGDQYYLENIFEALDSPGEWFLNRQTGKLYYIPMSGEEIDTIEAIAPGIPNIVVFMGNPRQNKFISYINFRGLTFSHNDWKLPQRVSGFAQNAFGVPGAIYGNGVRSCSLENCTIANIGTYAVELFRGCQNNRIAGCEMHDLGAGGIKIGERLSTMPSIINAEESNRNEITDNHIYDGGRFFPSALGIRVQHSNNNYIGRNHIHDLYYTGIASRGSWGYKPTRTYSNTIEDNYIHDIGRLANGDGPLLSDMGGIYTLGIQRGTVIRNNIIRDVSAIRYGGRGFHLDEGSAYILVENNLVYRTTHAGFHQNYGRENVIRNNIFAFGREEQVSCNRPQNHLQFTFFRNIVYWSEGKMLNLIGGDRQVSDYQFKFDFNNYWQTENGEITFNDLSWSQWQARGYDRNSIVADPQFAAPQNGDFQLESGSPVGKLGFQTLNLEKIN